MTQKTQTAELIAQLRSRINPHANHIGTVSYERRLCVEALETLVAENEALRKTNNALRAALRGDL